VRLSWKRCRPRCRGPRTHGDGSTLIRVSRWRGSAEESCSSVGREEDAEMGRESVSELGAWRSGCRRVGAAHLGSFSCSGKSKRFCSRVEAETSERAGAKRLRAPARPSRALRRAAKVGFVHLTACSLVSSQLRRSVSGILQNGIHLNSTTTSALAPAPNSPTLRASSRSNRTSSDRLLGKTGRLLCSGTLQPTR